MDISKVTVTYGRKINLKDYNQAHLELTIEGVIDPRETPEETTANIAALWEAAKASVKDQAMPLLKEQKPTVQMSGQGDAEALPFVPKPPSEQPHEEFEIDYMKLNYTKAGKPYIRVYGGHFTQYGVSLWPETIEMYGELSLYKEWNPEDEVTFEEFTTAVISVKPNPDKPEYMKPEKVIALR